MSDAQYTSRIEFRVISASPFYRVSNTGILQSSAPTKGKIWKTLKPHNKYAKATWKRPYLASLIHMNGKSFNVMIHRLVLEMFVGPCPPGLEACHNNGDSLDNRVENLRWDTRKNNHADKKRHGTLLMGSQIAGAILNEQDVEKIIAWLMEGKSGPEIRAAFPITSKQLSKIARKINWKHVCPDRPVMSVSKRGYRFSRRPKESGPALNVAIVEDIILMAKNGHTLEEIANKHHVSRNTVGKVTRKITWIHVDPDRPVISNTKRSARYLTQS